MIDWSCPACAQPVPYGGTPCPKCGKAIEWDAGVEPVPLAVALPRRRAPWNGPSLGLAVVALLLNFATLPGLGSAVAGRGAAFIQMPLAVLGIILAFSGEPGPMAFGIMLWFGTWVSGLVSGAKAVNAVVEGLASPPSPTSGS